jgi:hypothetical protein
MVVTSNKILAKIAEDLYTKVGIKRKKYPETTRICEKETMSSSFPLSKLISIRTLPHNLSQKGPPKKKYS